MKDAAMSNKRTRNDALTDYLSRSQEIKISVTGRKSGRSFSIPVWFVADDEKLYLLPVYGSDTQWYKNILKKPAIQIATNGAKVELVLAPVIDAKQVLSVVDKFRVKYGASDVKKYYSKFDVAVIAQVQ
jgi:deazaflavin-dependent oxidoreductase (nitroreductase family)